MNSEFKSMLVGAGVMLVVVGGVFGLWSMSVAPAPPAIAAATKAATQERTAVLEHMRAFIHHYNRANAAVVKDDKERALAHLVMLQENADELGALRLEHKIPEENVTRLRQQVKTASDAIRAGDATAAQAVTTLRSTCIECHAANKGPAPETIFKE